MEGALTIMKVDENTFGDKCRECESNGYGCIAEVEDIGLVEVWKTARHYNAKGCVFYTCTKSEKDGLYYFRAVWKKTIVPTVETDGLTISGNLTGKDEIQRWSPVVRVNQDVNECIISFQTTDPVGWCEVVITETKMEELRKYFLPK